MAKQRTITLTDRAPVKIDEDKWPLIAEGKDYAGQYDFQSFDGAWIKVRQHEDGRTLVYGYAGDWDGGGRPERENRRAGFIVDADKAAETIRQVADILAETECVGEIAQRAARDCIADLPAEELS